MENKKEIQKIIFAHSAGPQYGKGKGSYDLVKYLRSALPNNFKLLFPTIEKPSSPTYHKYKKMYAASFAAITDPVILIGHSLGASTLLQYLSEENVNVSIKALLLVSTPHWKSNMKEFELKKNFQQSIKNIPAIYLYHSKHDPEVPFEHLKFYEQAFPAAIVRKLEGNEHMFVNGLPGLVADIKTC